MQPRTTGSVAFCTYPFFILRIHTKGNPFEGTEYATPSDIMLHYLAGICNLDHGHCHIQLLVRARVLAMLLAMLKGLFPDGKALPVLGHSCLHIA